MKNVRVCYSKTNEAYKIQYRFFLWFWEDLRNGLGDIRYFSTLDGAKEFIKTGQLSSDWEVVNEH